LIRIASSISAKSGVFWIAPRKAPPSSSITSQALRAVAVALRGSPVSTDISPSTSPALITSSGLPLRVSAISPEARKYMALPAAFSANNAPPAAIASGLPLLWKNRRATLAL